MHISAPAMDPIQCFGREKLEPALDVEESSFLGPFKYSHFFYLCHILMRRREGKKKNCTLTQSSLPAELSGPQVSPREPVKPNSLIRARPAQSQPVNQALFLTAPSLLSPGANSVTHIPTSCAEPQTLQPH